MASLDPRAPVLVGIGIIGQREENPEQAQEPVALMIDAARAAGADAGAPSLLSEVQRIYVPQGRWSYENPARLVADAIGAPRATTILAKIGVLQQTLIGDACRRIAAGEDDVVLVVGGEAGYRMLRSSITGKPVPYADASGAPDEIMKPHEEMMHPVEIAAGLRGGAVNSYAIIESAYRAAHGWSIDEHRDAIAALYGRFSEIAIDNPHAWRRTPIAAETIRNASAQNPMLAFPYTRLHVSSWNVDQASAMLFCSVERAEALGVPRSQWVFPVVSSESNYMVNISARPRLGGSPGARLAGQAALAAAGKTVADLDFIELYTCFPVAVEVYADEVDIPRDRDLTITGGMPFAGGPLNNYVFQATCRMAELVRGKPGSTGFISSVSGLLTKQGFGVWTTEPEPRPFQFIDVTNEVAATTRKKAILAGYAGQGAIAGYTVVHDQGTQKRAIAVIDVSDGDRTVAYTEHTELMAAMEQDEFCGRTVQISEGVFTPV